VAASPLPLSLSRSLAPRGVARAHLGRERASSRAVSRSPFPFPVTPPRVGNTGTTTSSSNSPIRQLDEALLPLLLINTTTSN
jgi:hypothetical protein